MLNFSARAAGAVVVVSGELDMASAPLFRQALAEAEPRGGRVVLDMEGLTFMDSSGLRELVAFQNAGHVVDIREASEPVRAVLRMAGMEAALQLNEDPTVSTLRAASAEGSADTDPSPEGRSSALG